MNEWQNARNDIREAEDAVNAAVTEAKGWPVLTAAGDLVSVVKEHVTPFGRKLELEDGRQLAYDVAQQGWDFVNVEPAPNPEPAEAEQNDGFTNLTPRSEITGPGADHDPED